MGRARAWLLAYCGRFRGTGALRAPPPARPAAVLASFVGSFLGMLVLTAFDGPLPAPRIPPGMLPVPQGFVVASFGATAVLLFAAPAAPMAQPRAVVLGQTLSALVGVVLRVLLVELPDAPQASFAVAALAVAAAIAVMMLAGALHPAGAGTACIAVTSPIAAAQGWLFIVYPVLSSSLLITATAALWNNLFDGCEYPAYWLW